MENRDASIGLLERNIRKEHSGCMTTHGSHSVSCPWFWLSKIARINCLFSSRYCFKHNTTPLDKKQKKKIKEKNELC